GPPSDPVIADVISVLSGITGTPMGLGSRLDSGVLTSLEAMRVCIRLGERLGLSVAPEEVIAATTVSDLVDGVRATLLGPDGVGPMEGGPVGAGPAPTVPLADTQLGFLLEHEMRPQGRAGHCPISWLVRGELDRRALAAALGDVQRRHEALRSAY